MGQHQESIKLGLGVPLMALQFHACNPVAQFYRDDYALNLASHQAIVTTGQQWIYHTFDGTMSVEHSVWRQQESQTRLRRVKGICFGVCNQFMLAKNVTLSNLRTPLTLLFDLQPQIYFEHVMASWWRQVRMMEIVGVSFR